MADYCNFCETRRPQGGTNMLILNGGEMWLEFCPTCGDKEFLTNAEGKHQTLSQIFNKSDEEAPIQLVLGAIARENIRKETEFADKKAKRKANKVKREKRANSIGNLCPELKGLL